MDTEKLKDALEKIAYMSDPGSPEVAIVRMKAIASDALKLFSEEPDPDFFEPDYEYISIGEETVKLYVGDKPVLKQSEENQNNQQ